MDSFNIIEGKLKNILLKSNFYKDVNQIPVLDYSKDIKYVDYVSTIAFVLSPNNNPSFIEVANNIKKILDADQDLKNIISKIDVAGKGFVNFYLKDNIVREENVKDIDKIDTKYTGKNILVEHSSPNLFKPFSVGHLMNNFIGEFIVRAIKVGGGNVEVMAFPSDVSLGVAKALFIIDKDIRENKKDLNYFRESEENEIIKYLGESYVRGVSECDENMENLNEAKKILDKMYNLKDDSFYDLVSITRSRNENYFKRVLKEIGSDIKAFVYEREAGSYGWKIVKENIGKVFKESEGAIVYVPSEDRKDINTSVFINSQGYPTYEAKDLGLIDIKFSGKLSAVGINNFYPDLSLFVTDAEQIQHFKVVFDAASNLGVEWVDRINKSKHIPHGRMSFKGAKMSSRLGGVPLALDVIDSVCEEVKERAGEKIAHLSEDEKRKLEKEIALSALRVAVLRSKPGLNINFDPETSLSFDGDSGPYLMYTHARCASLLDKGKEFSPMFHNFEKSELEWKLHSFETLLKESVEELAPQKLVTYLFSIAQLFNSFYGSTQIITEDKERTEHNLAVVNCVKNKLKKGLFVLGINAPDRM